MLEKQDLKQLREIIKEEVSASEQRIVFTMTENVTRSVTENVSKRVTENVTRNVVEAIGEMLEQNISPQFDGLSQRFDGLSQRFDDLSQRLNRMESTMVTKDFLEERLTRFKDGLQNSALWVGRQVNRLTDVLYKNGVVTAEQLLEIRRGETT